jgi:putative ribosome biogenesis GTPase RsgA
MGAEQSTMAEGQAPDTNALTGPRALVVCGPSGVGKGALLHTPAVLLQSMSVCRLQVRSSHLWHSLT